MAKFSGQDFRIKIRVSTGPDVYTAIAGFRSDGMTLNNEAIDVTDKDGTLWKTLLEGAGVQSISLKGSGIVSDAAVFKTTLMGAAMGKTFLHLKLESGLGDTFIGDFLVTSLERGGEYNKEETFSCTFDSAGVIAYTAAT